VWLLSCLLILTPCFASAHRLDEYLQAATVSLTKDRVEVRLRLTPGVAVFRRVAKAIDGDGDGRISALEERAYADKVLKDLSLSVDGESAPLSVESYRFPKLSEMKKGVAEIEMHFCGLIPAGSSNRRIVFENRHMRPIAAYLANCLVPDDPDLKVTNQLRDFKQSHYEIDYSQSAALAAAGSHSHVERLAFLGGVFAVSGLAAYTRRRSLSAR
jgi:hypothetical protein